jgi:hypothetical protein
VRLECGAENKGSSTTKCLVVSRISVLNGRAFGHEFEVRDIVPGKGHFGKRPKSEKVNKNRGFSAFLSERGWAFQKPNIWGSEELALGSCITPKRV